MDCKLARQLLDFARPRRAELEPAEWEDLEAHLAECPECGPLAQMERQMDRRLGQVMQAVLVPPDLHSRIVTRLETERKSRLHKRQRWVAASLAAAATVLVAIWIGWLWLEKPRHVDYERVADLLYGQTFNPRAQVVEDYFETQGIHTIAPIDANYDLLRDYYVASLEVSGPFGHVQEKRVPKLLFTDGKSTAHVYILSAKDFVLAPPPSGSGWTAVLRRDPSGKYGYLVIYLGDPPLKVFPKEEQPSGT
jgi:hypothetical protein